MRVNPLIQNLYENTSKPAALNKAEGAQSDSFTAQLKEKIGEVNRLQAASDSAMADGAVNGAENIHESMIRLEEADIGLRMLTRVRNKALDAYHEMMRMQF